MHNDIDVPKLSISINKNRPMTTKIVPTLQQRDYQQLDK